MDALDDAIDELFPRAVEVLKRLVSNESTIGNEAGALEAFAAELDLAGFDLIRFPIPTSIGADPDAGVPSRPYEDRYDVIGRRGSADAGRTLMINGHIDVVPAEDVSRWTSPPFEPTIVDGWLVGRGAGDMKAGFAVGLLAVWALDRVEPGWMTGGLTFMAAIEEEATGNGTLAAVRAGYTADAAVLLEPTDLEILLGGISLIWVSIEIEGLAGHAEAALESVNPIVAAYPVISALQSLEIEMNAHHVADADADHAFASEHPYNVNIGTLHAGDWASSVPAVARLDVRVGHPRTWSSDEAFARVQEAVTAGLADDKWFAAHPPKLRMTGYRAQRYLQDESADVVVRLSDAHEQVHGVRPTSVAIGSTTDARFYVNQAGMPSLAYGPKTRNMHGTDEAVELASVLECAKVLARFLADWYRDPS